MVQLQTLCNELYEAMMRYRSEIKLLHSSKKKWALYKSFEKKIVKLVNKHGITIINIVYDDNLFTKTVIFDDINEGENKNVIIEIGFFLGHYNLKENIVSFIEILPTVKKIKYVIKLIDSTPAKWTKYMAMEPEIQKLAEDEDIIRENVFYYSKDNSLSLVATYPNELARANIENKITLCMKRNGLERKIIEAIEIKDYSDDIIDLPLYNANKLIDKAEQSLDKLSHM